MIEKLYKKLIVNILREEADIQSCICSREIKFADC